MSAEIILIGGASILINYGFREMTYEYCGPLRDGGKGSFYGSLRTAFFY